MAACLVPDVPAVRIALKNLSELDKRLREEGVSFSQEASLHLREIAEAIKELESSRKTAREKLEVETIETSKLRQRIMNLEDDIRTEISACITAARKRNAAEMNRLQSELKTILHDIESVEQRQQLLEQENTVFFQDKDNVKGNYKDAIDELNQLLSDKASKQILLSDKKKEIKSLKDQILQVQTARNDLKEDMIQKSKTFADSKHSLEKEIEKIVLEIKEQRKTNAEKHKELKLITSELQDKEETITQCNTHISQLEKSIARLTASKIKCKECIHEKISEIEELDRQKVFHEKGLLELAEAFEQKVQALQEQITEIENKMKEEQKIKSALSESIANLSDTFSTQRKEEDDAIAKQRSLTKRLEESKQRHEEHIMSTAKCKIEIKNMKEEMRQLHDANIISADLFKKNLEELEGQLAKENISRSVSEAEKEKICQSLKTLKEKHEEHLSELNAAIKLTKKRYKELLGEEKKLQDHVLLSSVIEGLTEELAKADKERIQMEMNYQAEIQQLTRDAESITQACQEKEQDLKVQESVLEKVECQFDIDHLRHQTLQEQTTELKSQKKYFKLSIQEVTKQTAALLGPKEDLKRELETLRAKHMEMLTVHAAEISAIEKNIYENGVMLEQVNMENSRLHLCIEQMKEDISNANKQKEKYTQEAEWMKEAVQSLFKSLMDVFATDMVLTEESADRDQKFVETIGKFVVKIQKRKHHISDINNRLENELVGIRSMLENPNYKRLEINSPTIN
ncbi:repetitive organellar protein [Myxocyprinus asiaticus]|uniref:repetitive organellar protein n=1 Tax=Myxocyprinus asiaticus TaxID=70543 RepID=UPI002221F0BC|nr:repetitive organellar protein [Myxocyprinus asiaticus]